MKNKLTSRRTLRAVLNGMLLVTLVAFATSSFAAAASTKSAVPATKDLMGVWIYVGEPGKIEEAPATGGFIKHRTERHWVAVNVDGRSSLVTSTHGGTWRVSGNQYEETVAYGGDHHALLMGKTYHWTIKIEGDLMIKTGTDNPWHEVWKRVK